MAQSDLDLLIKDFSIFNTKNRMQKFLKPYLEDLIVKGLEVMGQRTIGDTNQAKSLFVDIALKEFGRDISWIYDMPTDFWGNNRDKGKYLGYEVVESLEGGYSVEIEMVDDGLYGQEFYGTPQAIDDIHIYPSPRREYPEYEPRHISNTQDDLDDGNIAEFEAILDEVEDLLYAVFEGRI